jgi:1-deoxy-D-xylulose-5-phosphate synthase
MTTHRPLLDDLKGPEDIRGLDAEGRVGLAREIRQRISQVVSKNGGHFASNMGVVELSIALHTVFESPRDRIVWDVSHQCYPHKLLTGRAPEFHTLRTYEGISGFCHKGESEHDTAFAGHAGTASSIAAGIARAQQLTGTEAHSIAVVGDASLASGMTLEALNHIGMLTHEHQGDRLIVVFNDNGCSIAPPVGGLEKTFSSLRPWQEGQDHDREVAKFFESMGLTYHGPVDGHDTEALINALEFARRESGPVFLHVHTRKGAGLEVAVDDPVSWHAAKGFADEDGNHRPGAPAAPPKSGRDWTRAFSDALIELAEIDERVVAVTAAMPGGTGLNRFMDRFPKRCFDVGICEQHGAGFASGLSYGGLRPVLTIYSTFLQRAYDQVVHDVALQGNPMLIAMDRGGLVGADGVTHQGLFDISYLRCIPDVVLVAPMDEPELKAMMRWALDSRLIVGIRYPRASVPEPIHAEPTPIELGRGEIVAVGDGDVALFAYGAMVPLALEARELLAAEGISVTVVNARFAKPVDVHLLEALLESHAMVITCEDHAMAGGFGSACLEAVVNLDPDLARRLKIAGVPDRFVHHGERKLQLRDAGLDPAGLAARVKTSLPTVRSF